MEGQLIYYPNMVVGASAPLPKQFRDFTRENWKELREWAKVYLNSAPPESVSQQKLIDLINLCDRQLGRGN